MFEVCELLETAGEFSQTTRALRKEDVCEELYREAGDQLRTQLDTLAKQCHCLQVAPTPNALLSTLCGGLNARMRLRLP
jgi:hypothetical protein